MAYDLQGALAEGYTPTEIAEHLAKQRKYDIAGARKEGYTDDEIAQHLASKMPTRNKSIAGDIGTKFKQGLERLPATAAGLADIPFALAGHPIVEQLATKAGEMTGFKPSEWANEAEQQLSPAYQQGQQEINQVWQDPSKSSWDVAKAYLTHPGQIAGTISEAVPMTAAAALTGGAAGAGLGAESAAARAAMAGLGEGAVTAGSIYDQAVQGGAAPQDAQRKALAALGAGTITGAIGAGGAGLAGRLGIVDPESIFNRPAVQALSQTEINTFMNAANRSIGSRIGVGAIKEGLLEELPQSVQEQMWQNYAEKKPIMQDVARSAVEGALAGSAMGGGANLISKSMSADEVKAEVDRRTKEKADEIQKLQERMATEAMGGTRESRPLDAALAAQGVEDKMGRANVRTELARPIYKTKEEVTAVLEKLREVYPELDQTQLNQTRLELQRIRDTLPTQADAAKTIIDTKPTVAPTPVPVAKPAPVVNPLAIDDEMLNKWGIKGKATRNALKEYGDLTNPEHVQQVSNILTTLQGNDKLKAEQKLAVQQGLAHIASLQTQGAPNVTTTQEPTSGGVQNGGARTAPVGQGSLPGMELPGEQPQPTPQEVAEPGRGGMDVPSGVSDRDVGPTGESPVAEPSPLVEPTAPQAKEVIQPEPEVTSVEEPIPEKINHLKEIKKYQKALEKVDPEIAAEAEDLITEYNQAAKGGKRTKGISAPHITTAEQGIETWIDWVKRTYPDLDVAEAKRSRYISNPTSVQRLKDAFNKLYTPNLLRVKPPHILGTYDELPEPLRSSVKGRATAFVSPWNQQEHYIAEVIQKGDEIGRIMHEKGTHLGMPKLVGRGRINALSNRVVAWATEKGNSVEHKIAREAYKRANQSKEEHGSDRWKEESVAYFADIAVNKYKIDPLKDQPKEFVKVAGWLRELWNGVLSTIRKLQYNPEALTAQDIVSMIYGASRIEMHEDYQGRPNVPANEKVAKPGEEVEDSVMESFIGKKAKTFNQYPHITFGDNNKRAELDASKASLNIDDNRTRDTETKDYPQERMYVQLTFPELYNAYPALKDLPVTIKLLPAWMPESSNTGSFKTTFGGKQFIEVKARTVADAEKIILHEIQHWIQTIEGWQSGGRGGFTREEFEAYRGLFGEREARLVEERKGMTAEERAANPAKLESNIPTRKVEDYTGHDELGREEGLKEMHKLAQESYDQYDDPDDAYDAMFEAANPRQKAVLRAFKKDQMLGFDYPHQVIEALLEDETMFNGPGYELYPSTKAALTKLGNKYWTDQQPSIMEANIPGFNKKKKAKRVSDQERQDAQNAGRQVYEEPEPPTVAERIKNTLGDNMLGWLAVKLVGGGESLALKGTKMFGPEARLNPVTGKELGYLNYHRALHDNDLATGAAQYGYLELDKEGVFHVKDSPENVVALNDIANKIKSQMVADGMTEAAADDAFAHMMLTDRFKELQKQGVVSTLEFSKADHAYGQQMKDKYRAGYDEWQKMYQTIRGRTIKSLVDSGTFSPKKAKEFLDRLEYIPFNREQGADVSDAVFLRSLLSAKGEHHIKGSERQVKDVMANIVDNQVWLMKRAVRNNASNLVADTMTEMHKRNPLMGGYETTKEDKSPNVISYLKNGELQYYKVLDPNDAAIFASAPAVGNTAIRIMRMFTGYLRRGVTLMPSFHYGQIIQDAMRAPAVAGTKAGMAQLMKTSVPEFWHNIAGETPLARSLRRAGIVGQIDYQDTYDNWRKEVLGAKRKGMGSILERAERIAQANDLSTRAAVYNDILKQTGNENEASLRALMMINFQNRGHSQVMNTLMAAVPFVNSRIQGEYRLLMALTGKIPGVSKQQAKQLIAWRAAKLAAFTMIYAMASGGNDDYENAGEDVKNHNFLLQGIKIPVAPEFLPLKVAIEKAYRLGTDQQFETGAKAARAELSAVAGLFLGAGDITPTMLKPLIENTTNYSFFSGHNLVGFNQLGKDTNLQFNEGTSEFSKGFSNMLQSIGGNTANISPIKLDNLIRGWFGTMGKDFLYTVDMMTGDKPMTSFNQLPLAGGMFYNMQGGALKSDFYDLKDASDRANNTLNDLKKSDPSKVTEYYQENKPILAIHSRLEQISQFLDHARKEKQYVTKAYPDTAADRVNEINARVNEMLKNNLPPIMNYLADQDAR